MFLHKNTLFTVIIAVGISIRISNTYLINFITNFELMQHNNNNKKQTCLYIYFFKLLIQGEEYTFIVSLSFLEHYVGISTKRNSSKQKSL